jgi:hypothetical protein
MGWVTEEDLLAAAQPAEPEPETAPANV